MCVIYIIGCVVLVLYPILPNLTHNLKFKKITKKKQDEKNETSTCKMQNKKRKRFQWGKKSTSSEGKKNHE